MIPKRTTKLICASAAFAIAPLGVFGAASANAAPSDVKSSAVVQDTKGESAFWFEDEDGRRTFDTQGSVLVPHILEGDRIEIDGDVINTYNKAGTLVGSLKADLPEGMKLKKDAEGIRAVSESSRVARCISNKWVGLGLNIAGDALVCGPFGAATGGVGGLACGAAVGAGITAASC